MVSNRTLVIQNLAGIGDTMWFLRHYHAIAAASPTGKITLLTRQKTFADIILKDDPYIEEVLWLDQKADVKKTHLGPLKLAGLLRPYKFQTAWVLHSRSWRYGVGCYLAGIPNIYGPYYAWRHHLPWFGGRISKMARAQHPIKRADALLSHHQMGFLNEKRPYFLSDIHQETIHKAFKDCPRPWIALGLSSSELQKKWPSDYFAALAKELLQRTKGTIFLMGGLGEDLEAKAIAQKLPEKNVHIITQYPIDFSLNFLSQCDVIIGNDTGITNAAPLLNIKGLVLLGDIQIPIQNYNVGLEGIRPSPDHIFKKPPNNMHELTSRAVIEKLISLGWV